MVIILIISNVLILGICVVLTPTVTLAQITTDRYRNETRGSSATTLTDHSRASGGYTTMSSYGSMSPTADGSPNFDSYETPYYCAQMTQDSPTSCENTFWNSEYDVMHQEYQPYRDSGNYIGRNYVYEDNAMHISSTNSELYQDVVYTQGYLAQNGYINSDPHCLELCTSKSHPPTVRVVKRRNTANKKERRRTQSINSAFSELRDKIPNVPTDTKLSKKERRRTHNINTAFTELKDRIPNVPADTKLSKIKTLRLATSYISYLLRVLECDAEPAGGFKAELVNTQARRSRNQTNSAVQSDRKSKGRTGWPQHVWALELKTEHEH